MSYSPSTRPSTKKFPMHSVSYSAATYRECRRELMEFRNANRDTIRDERYFDWRYSDRPGQSEPIIVWAENERGEKIGSLSLIPHHYSVNKTSCPLGRLGDISVAKEYRGKGIARQMFYYLSGLDAVKSLAACIVLPNEDAARALEKSGWVKVSRLDRYVKILNTEQFLEKKVGRPVAKIISSPLGLLLRAISHELFLKKPAGFSAQLVERFDDSFDDLWNELNKEGVVIGLRNKEYLTWRYSEHPVVKYQVFTLTNNGKLCGYIVFHVDLNACHIYDLLCLKEGDYPTHLLSNFLNFIRRKTTSSVIIINGSENMSSGIPFGKFGFIRRPDYLDFMVRMGSGSEDFDCLSEGRRWFLTMGDKDV